MVVIEKQMKKIIYLVGEINEGMFTKFVEDINSTENKITIYLSSGGGNTAYSSAIADIINSDAERFEVVLFSIAASAAFTLFFGIECSRKILPICYGLYHLGEIAIDGYLIGDKFVPTTAFQKQFVKSIPLEIVEIKKLMLKLKFTEKEIKQVLAGKDVTFGPERMQQFLDNSMKK